MSIPLTLNKTAKVVYPDSDGLPMAENTVQFRWIVTIESGLDAQFAADPHVFVAGDLFWYPVEGDPGIRTAPDVMVVFGRPKGDRSSYMQWEEDHIPPQVVFEIWSPGNRPIDLVEKLEFYEKYGVEEFYMYDPDRGDLVGFVRAGDELKKIANMRGWVSPRLGIRFDLEGDELVVVGADGKRFTPVLEWHRRAAAAEAEVARLRALLEEKNK